MIQADYVRLPWGVARADLLLMFLGFFDLAEHFALCRGYLFGRLG